MLYAPHPFKRCPQCGEWFPPTSQCFSSHKKTTDGLNSWCRECCRRRTRIWKQENASAISEYNYRYHRANTEAISARGRRRRQEHPEKVREEERRWRRNNPEKKREGKQRWEKANPEKVRAQRHRSYLANFSKNKERNRQWQRENPDKTYEATRRYRQTHPDKAREIYHKRRARKRALPHTFNKMDWHRALDYFEHCCAYCGRPQGLWHTIAQDHFIPESKGGGYTPANIIPACHSQKGGEDGCNNLKNDRNPTEWLLDRFGPRKAKAILKRIAAYFEWVKSQES